MADAYSYVHSEIPSGAWAWRDTPRLTPGDQFDEVSATIVFNGTASALTALSVFLPGMPVPASSGNPGLASRYLYCKGPQIEKEEFGHVWATVSWFGLSYEAETHGMKNVTRTLSVRETEWPQTIDGTTIYVPKNMIGEGATGLYNGRVRLRDNNHGISVTGISKTTWNTPPAPDTLAGYGITAPIVTGLIDISGWVSAGGAIKNYPYGWVLLNYTNQHTIRIPGGTETIFGWTAYFEWVPEFTP